MTQFLPPNLLALFAPRDAIPYKPPLGQLTWEKDRTKSPYIGIAQCVHLFEHPKDTPPPTRGELKAEKKRRRIREKGEKRALEIEDEVSAWDPHNDPNANSDAFKTLFVGRINYDTSESKLRREFEAYGKIKKIHMVKNRATGRSRGYAFIEYDKERDMHAAYKSGDGKKIDGRRVLVDVERGRTVKGWRPRRLGGGLGATRAHVEEGANVDNPMERDHSRDYEREREDRSHVPDRSSRDTREKRDIRRSDRGDRDRDRRDRDRGDRERGDRERGDRERGDRERGDRERGDRERGDRERGDRERGDRERGDKERGDRDRGDRDREKRKRDDRDRDRGSDKRDRDRKRDKNRDDDAGDGKKEEKSRDKDRESRHRHRDRSREKDRDSRRERRRDRDDKDRDRSGRDRESKHDSKSSADVKVEEVSTTKENANEIKQEDASGGYYGSSNTDFGEGGKTDFENNGYQKGFGDNGYPQEGMDYQQNDSAPTYGKSTNYDEYKSSSMPSEDY